MGKIASWAAHQETLNTYIDQGAAVRGAVQFFR